MRDILVKGKGPIMPKGMKIYTWSDGRFAITVEPHTDSSEMQPQEANPDTIAHQRWENEGGHSGLRAATG